MQAQLSGFPDAKSPAKSPTKSGFPGLQTVRCRDRRSDAPLGLSAG